MVREILMNNVWSEISLGGIPLKNRFMHSAVSENCCSERGEVTDRLLACYECAGESGELGLVVTGLAYVNRQGQKWPHQMGAWDDSLIPGLAQLAAILQKHGTKAFVQLATAGVYADPSLTGLEAVGPSSIDSFSATPGNRGMAREEIHALAQDFGEAARRVREAGFSGVELHGAHGYGLSQFLSPLFNKRVDEYGGSPENRARIVVDILHVIKEKAGRDFPVMIKMNGSDFVEGGTVEQEALCMAKLMEKAGLDAVECSGGMNFNPSAFSRPSQRVHPRTWENEAYFRKIAGIFTQGLNIPVALVGGIRTLEKAEKLIEEGCCDMVSLARPLIRTPDLVQRWKHGNREPSDCLSCNRCLEHSRTVGGVVCAIR